MKKIKLLLLAMLLVAGFVEAQPAETYYSNIGAAALQDFMDNRFGMFIHWGGDCHKGDGNWLVQKQGGETGGI